MRVAVNAPLRFGDSSKTLDLSQFRIQKFLRKSISFCLFAINYIAVVPIIILSGYIRLFKISSVVSDITRNRQTDKKVKMILGYVSKPYFYKDFVYLITINLTLRSDAKIFLYERFTTTDVKR